MEHFKPELYERRRANFDGWEVCITSYKLRDRFVCKIDNVDPGATIARGHGATREEAEAGTLERAKLRLGLTRRIRVTREALHVVKESVERLSAELDALEKASQTPGETSDTELSPVSADTEGNSHTASSASVDSK
jgi:hypothetical protein